MKNIKYKLYTLVLDFIFPPSALRQRERYRKKYGVPKENIIFYGKGLWTDIAVLQGTDFYKSLEEFNNSNFCKQMRKDIKEKGSFCPSDYM